MKNISPQISKKLFFDMLRIRLVEEKVVDLYPDQQMRCPVHLCIGQEATPVGVCSALSIEDPVLSNHRAHGHYLAKGGDLKKFLAEMYGKETGCCQGRGGSMHLIDLSVNFLGSTPIVGGTIPVATGVAFAEQLRKQAAVTVAFFGEAAAEEGVWHECLNFAALKKLPILYVCENNLYSVNTPLSERQPARPIVDLAKAHGINAWAGDGNNVVEVYESTQKALDLIRQGQGPVFLEFATYRWREHCGPNDDIGLGSRTKAELTEWQKRCPVETFKNRLLAERVISLEELKAMHKRIEEEIDAAVQFAQISPFPKTVLTAEDVYA